MYIYNFFLINVKAHNNYWYKNSLSFVNFYLLKKKKKERKQERAKERKKEKLAVGFN